MVLPAENTNHIDHEWFQSTSAHDLLFAILDRNTQKKKQFGLIEGPSLPPQLQIQECTYKLFLCGKSGVGKSCTVAKLAGSPIPERHYDTPGIEMTTVYWPARIADNDRLVMFKLEFWDAGDAVTKEYDHILRALKDKADAVIFVFSYVDKSSFDDLSSLMSRITTPQDNVTKLIIGTKFDQHAKSEVTLRDIREFESVHLLPILRTKNIPVFHPSGSRSELSETAPILNTICENLWRRDLSMNGSLLKSGETYV